MSARVEVFADVTCPFTHVGLRRLLQRRHELGRDDVRLVLRAWPLELVNGQSLDAHAVAHKAEVLRAQVAPELFGHVDEAAFPRTNLPALALTSAAYERDDDTGEAVALALRDAVFEHGRDISDLVVLAAVAAAHGVTGAPWGDTTAVLLEYADGQRRGVRGSPHFFPPDGSSEFCPTLDITNVDGELHVEVDLEHFDAIAQRCFG